MTFEIKFNNKWIDNINNYKDLFKNAKPYSHVIIDNFFDDETINMIIKEFPLPHKTINNYDWKYYHNPLEHKYTLNDFQKLPINASFIFPIFPIIQIFFSYYSCFPDFI